MACENNPLNTGFVLLWLLHARLRERTAERRRPQATPHGLAAGRGKRDATSLEAVVDAVGMGDEWRAAARGTPAIGTPLPRRLL